MTSDTEMPYVVGIGTSAQGLDALRAFFSSMSDQSGMAFVVVQHLAPEHESNLADLLSRAAPLPVESADDGTVVEPDHVYVISPGDQLSYRDGALRTERMPDLDSERHTIDFFFRSIAEELEGRAIGMLLSGAGSDGTAGLDLIKRHGGVTMAQDPEDAGVAMMPRNAIRAGHVDIVAAAADLADRLDEVVTSGRRYGPVTPTPEALADEQAETLDAIMRCLRDRTGNDLSEYKRPTVLRRIGRRMQVHQIETIEEYRRLLESNADEVDALFDELLITVTRFFRDREVWQRLREVVVPTIFEGKGRDDEVRVWVPGCATGEEAYTVAMLLHDHASDIDEAPEIKVFATDIDHEAIRVARNASYPTAIVSDVPTAYLHRYFRVEERAYQVAEEVRNLVLFAPQNALADPPFSRLDLVTCRNFLIYLQPTAQTRLLQLLHYGLRDEGFLVLGSSETTAKVPDLFEPFSEDHHIYRATAERGRPDLVPGSAFGFEFTMPNVETDERKQQPEADHRADLEQLHREALVDSYELASVLVDEDHRLLHAVGDTSSYLTVPAGTPSQDLLPMVDERLRPVARTLLFEAFHADGDPEIRQIPGNDEGEPPVEVRAQPLDPEAYDHPVVELSFRPVAGVEWEGRGEQDGGPDEESVIDHYERELQQTRTRLEQTVREYESTNQQLRASNEELMSMNEELQSTTEELETSKEELQSMNEELQTVNDELNDKIRQLDAVNSDLRNLMRSTQIGTLFLDRTLAIQRFTDPVTDLFNIRDSDHGRPLDHVTHILETDQLIDDARRVLDEVTTVEREVRSSDGRWFLVRTLPYLTLEDRVDGVVLTFVDITERREIQDRLAENEKKFRTVFESAADPMFIYRLDEEGEPEPFLEANSVAVEKLGRPREALQSARIDELLGGEDFDVGAHLERVAREGGDELETTLAIEGRDEPIPVEVKAQRMRIDDRTAVVEILRDISDQKRYEQALLESKERAEELAELRSMFLSTLSHDVRSPLTVILSTAGVLQQTLDGEEAEKVDRIERSCRQLRRILDSILRMAKLESEETAAMPETFDIVSKVDDIVDLYEPLAAKEGLALTCEVPESPVEVELDSRFLTQILNNLVDNAIKYTDEGTVEVRLTAGPDQIRIQVEDSGTGIPEKEQELIFERFGTATNKDPEHYESTGLGLAIARMLVDAMEGTISVESTDGEGSVFTVELPRRIEEEPARGREPGTPVES